MVEEEEELRLLNFIKMIYGEEKNNGGDSIEIDE